MRDKLKDEEYLRERYNKDNARYTKYMTTYQTKLSNPEQYDIQIIYDSDKSTKRPLGFFVEYKIDGIEQSPIYHYN